MEEVTMEQLKTYLATNLMELEQNPSPQKGLIDNFNLYYDSKNLGNSTNLGKLISAGRDRRKLFTLTFEGGNIIWPQNKTQWVIEYSELGRQSPPEPPFLPNGGPDYVSAQAHFENSMPLGGGFRRKKRKRTRRKRCSKKSSKKNKKTFRR